MEKYDLIIIGSGPAGLSAAIYGIRAGLKLLVLEKYPVGGGQILNTYEVDNYPGLPGINGFDLGERFQEHADRLGVKFLNAEVTGVELKPYPQPGAGEAQASGVTDPGVSGGDPELAAASHPGELSAGGAENSLKIVHTDEGDFASDTLILAAGADHAKLGVPGEEELTGKGVSYCATCDGAFYKDRVAAVIGGGDVALEDAIYLAKICRKVYCIHRRDQFRGARILQEKLLSLENVEILYSHVAVSIEGEDHVKGLLLRDVKTGQQKELLVNGVFIAVGIHPNTELFADLVACDRDGYILAGEDCRTDVPGIYAAGDIRKKPLRQIVTAVADGANAAVSAGNDISRLTAL